MRAFNSSVTLTVPSRISLADSVFRYADESPGFVAFRKRGEDGQWADVTAEEFAEQVAAVAGGLIASGISPGDRVAIMASTRYEWVLLDYAIWTVGACTVTVYETSSAEQVSWILNDSGAVLLVVETPAHRELVHTIENSLGKLGETLQIDAGAIDELMRRGKLTDRKEVVARRRTVSASTPATLVYTSGTTGRPKGVVLTHGNLFAESMAARNALSAALRDGRRTLMFLPLAHIFARVVSLSAFDAKVTVGHTSDWATLVDQFAEFKPHFVLSVPRVFEKIYNGARQNAQDAGRGNIFDAAADVAIEWSRCRQSSARVGPGLALKHRIFSWVVYRRIKTVLGGQCTHVVSGGAPLGARLGHYFNGIGVPVLEGYGLTETSAAITLNTPSHHKIGSVGRPFDGHSAKVAEDGELLVKGPVVFDQYWRNDDATAEAFDDGWFRTGDFGTIDEQGYVFITGRKKEILVTAAGKNVSPAPLEDALRAHPLINQAMVLGDARPFISALITLDSTALRAWRERRGLGSQVSVSDLELVHGLHAEIDSAVSETNKLVSKAEQIKQFRILDTEWSQSAGELTPKLSLKRDVILANYAFDVEAIYA
ncbi:MULTISPECIES: long-chain fatty acid--CoA ligase [Rhodococcus]|uniref:AMP-dependent synthetase/ligase n=1 Tax=Rhodococcus TaxID=1827 RepID=UPI0029529784|nr:long-chain fatty acid--CoA ligase [Rhodococcus sp. IEGM 1241]MDV8009818.1 long-chain fatty acid--CoA ligase [Rhodococcus sp. IEGM 1241]